MRVCTNHPHSGEKTARRCYEKTMRKRADRRLRGEPVPMRVVMAHHRPCRVVSREGVVLFVFSENENTPY